MLSYFLLLLMLVGFLLFGYLLNIPELLCISRDKLPTDLGYPVFFRNVKNILIGAAKYISYFMFFPVFFSFNIPISASMTPTYRVSDVIFASHCIYGISPHNIGITPIRNFVKQYWKYPIFATKAPQMGDNVVFRVDFSEMPFSKRIVAVGGDKIYINGPIITINGKVCSIKFLREEELIDNGVKYLARIYERELPNGIKHEISIPANLSFNTINESFYYEVPQGECVLMGDNYYNSDDFRGYLGTVANEDIFSKLQFVAFRNPGFRLLDWINTRFGIIVS